MPKENHEIDIVIGTDGISEGQNLQDCDYFINYDIHWNPVRIIQCLGSIDRIGSTNPQIQLVNYWPDISLDDYINLKDRVENRMVIADATGSENPLNPKTNEISQRNEQLRRLQDEVIEMEDFKTVISITDLGLNDFRMDLVSYMKEHGDPSRTPNGMHAIVPADPERGLHPGVLFTLRNREDGVNIDQLNRLHPYYLMYVGEDGQIITRHTQVKRLLDLARTACKGRDEPILYLCHKFNSATKDGRDMKRYSLRLDQAIRSMIEVKEESDIDNLFTPGTTVQAITYGDGPSVVIEAVGHPDIFRAAVDKVCFAGRVVHIGYAKEAVSQETKYLFMKEIDILGSRNANLSNFSDVIQVLESGRYPVAESITLCVSFDQVGDALAAWAAGPCRVTKIHVEL